MEIEKINNTELSVKVYQNQRVVTFRDIDTVHERPEGTGIWKFLKLGVDIVSRYIYSLYQATIKEVREVANKSRADYFKERRKQSDTKAFYVEVDRKKLEFLEGKLSERGQTKKEWLNEKIDRELEE